MRSLLKINSVKTTIRQFLLIFRTKEFDTSTIEGRSQERYRRAALTSLAFGSSKCISFLTQLVAVPLTLSYLGTERYGVWMTISSTIPILGFADFGLGLGLMNAISEAYGKDDQKAAINYVSSGFFMLLGVAVLITTIFAVAYPFVPWDRLFNIKSALTIHEAAPATLLFLVFFALNLPLRVTQRVQFGYQEGFINSLWETLGMVLGLMGLLLVIYLHGGLVFLVLAVVGAPVIALSLNGLSLFGFKRPWLRPRWKFATSSCAKSLFRIGAFFFILQFGMNLIHSTDNLIVTQVLGPEAVTQYSIPYRMFGLATVILGMVVGPLWPAYGEAIARREIAWVRKTLIRSLFGLAVVVGLPSLVLVIFGNSLLHLWVGPQITAPWSLLIGLGVWNLVLSLGSSMSIILNAANIFQFQMIAITVTLVGSIIGKIILCHIFGIAGIIWGTVIPFSLFFLIPYAIYMPKILISLERGQR